MTSSDGFDKSKKLGSLIREYREKRDCNLEILAIVVGVSKECLRQIEEGISRNPSVFTVLRLVEILQIPIHRLQGIVSLKKEESIIMKKFFKMMKKKPKHKNSKRR